MWVCHTSNPLKAREKSIQRKARSFPGLQLSGASLSISFSPTLLCHTGLQHAKGPPASGPFAVLCTLFFLQVPTPTRTHFFKKSAPGGPPKLEKTSLSPAPTQPTATFGPDTSYVSIYLSSLPESKCCDC